MKVKKTESFYIPGYLQNLSSKFANLANVFSKSGEFVPFLHEKSLE
jgi:hypothetical protein